MAAKRRKLNSELESLGRSHVRMRSHFAGDEPPPLITIEESDDEEFIDCADGEEYQEEWCGEEEEVRAFPFPGVISARGA